MTAGDGFGVGPPEEPWEQEIGDLLGSLPLVDPPAGFLDAAIDHRPRHAGRILVSSLAVALAAVGALIAARTDGQPLVQPALEALAQRHQAIQAELQGVPDDDQPGSASSSVAAAQASLVELPLDAGWAGSDDDAAADQPAVPAIESVYASADGAVSVFVQDGAVDWEGLGLDGRQDVDGLPVWVDAEHAATVVEVGGDTVTVVGLSPDRAGELLQTMPDLAGDDGADRGVTSVIASLVEQLGFPS